MTRRRRRSRRRVRVTELEQPRPRADLGATVAVTALASVLAGTALLVDPAAASSFDAPKRLVSLVGIGVASTALVAFSRRDADRPWSWRAGSLEQRAALALLLVALGGAGLSAFLSPRRVLALEALRVLLLFALLLPLGASRALEGRRSWVLAWTFFGACAVNAFVSTLQRSGTFDPFRGATFGGRAGTGGFVGNDGFLALLLALAAVAAVAVLPSTRRPMFCLVGVGGTLLFVWGVLVNQSLTALMALFAGSIVVMAMLPRRRAVILTALSLLILAGGLLVHPALSARAREAFGDVRAGAWDRLLSYRLGPWATAVEMARARPLVGWGPGTFGAEFVSHRLAAELRLHRRFVNPFLAGSYTEAHSDYLQSLAEVGTPATVAVLGAVAFLLAGLMRVARHADHDSSRREAIVLLAILLAGGAAALTWFPLQRPVSAVPLLLAAGRAWRVCSASATGEAA